MIFVGISVQQIVNTVCCNWYICSPIDVGSCNIMVKKLLKFVLLYTDIHEAVPPWM